MIVYDQNKAWYKYLCYPKAFTSPGAQQTAGQKSTKGNLSVFFCSNKGYASQ